jgi:hypothetical protein
MAIEKDWRPKGKISSAQQYGGGRTFERWYAQAGPRALSKGGES